MMELLAQTSSIHPLAPLWIIGPMGIVAMLILGGHVHLTARICEPESRRRIRMATGMLGMTAVPIATAALSLIPPANQRLFAVAWMLVAGLIIIVLLLAFLDMLNTFRLYADARKTLRRQARDALAARDQAAAPSAPPSGDDAQTPPPPTST